MIKKEYAVKIQKHSLKAISELTQILNESENQCSKEKFETLKKGVGIAIGEIQIELLEALYSDFPELDDLK